MSSAGMDTGAPVVTAETIQGFFVAAIMVVFYDYFLTVGPEIRLIWRRPFHMVTIAWLVNRYLSLIASFIRLAAIFVPLSYQGCRIVSTTHSSIMTMSQIVMWGIQFWRVSALYGHNRKFLYTMIFFPLTLTVLTSWIVISSLSASAVSVYEYGCMSSYALGVPITGATVAWAIQLVWESLVVSLTIIKTWRTVRTTRDIYGRPFLSTVLLQYGVFYFLIILFLCLVNILTFTITSPYLSIASLSWISTCVSIAMTSRLILNLRENMDASIVSGGDEHVTADITMTNIISRQLELFNESA